MASRVTRFVWTAAGIGCAASLLMTVGGCADKLILFPSTAPIPVADGQRLVIDGEQGSVEVWRARAGVDPAASPAAYVLSFPGNADRAERQSAALSQMLGDRAVEVWAVNYPGYGGSDGPARLNAIPQAALDAFDALAETADDKPVLIWGDSLGTTAALHVAAERDVSGVVLRNPPPLRRMILVRNGWWNLWLLAVPVALQVPTALNSLDSSPLATAPAVFLLSDADRVVPPDYQRLVFDAYGGPKTEVLLRGGHNDGLDAAELRSFETAFDALLQDAGVR